MTGFYTRHSSMSQLRDGSAYLLSVAALLSPPTPKGGQLLIYYTCVNVGNRRFGLISVIGITLDTKRTVICAIYLQCYSLEMFSFIRHHYDRVFRKSSVNGDQTDMSSALHQLLLWADSLTHCCHNILSHINRPDQSYTFAKSKMADAKAGSSNISTSRPVCQTMSPVRC